MTPSQLVLTPNGPGRIQGAIDIWDRGAHYTLLVRHVLAEMTGREAGLCQSALSHREKDGKTVPALSVLWAYEAGDVRECKEEK